jgi:hypothetical protein
MPAEKITVPPEVFQVKVTLLDSMPPIWRRLLVPANLTLGQLHDVLQAAMGWQDCHMHEFRAGNRHFGIPDRLMGMPPVENERTVHLSNVLGRVGAKAIYTYDFGDSWEHTSCWKSDCLLIPAPTIRFAPAANAPVHLKIAAVSPDFTTYWMLSEILPTNSMTNCGIGLGATMIPTFSPSMMSTG